MKHSVLALVALLIFTVYEAPGGAQTPVGGRLHLRIEAADAAALRDTLEQQGYDVLGVDPQGATVDVAASAAEWDALIAGGFSAALMGRSRPLRAILSIDQPGTAVAPAGPLVTAAAAPATYPDLDEVIARLHQIAAAYPALARVVDLTTAYAAPPTFEGRHLFALKISDNAALDENEPAVLIVSGHHAREIVTPVIALDAAERLTSGYAGDSRIAAAVNGHEIWIAPVWNPDGYHYVFTSDNLWRKNRRVFAGGVGVDQNRNYPQGWSAPCAGSTSVASETYKGPQPASEAETQTLMIWSRAERFAKVVDYHSTGREVLYGYLCLSHPFSSWMQQEAIALSQASGYGGVTRVPSAEGEHQQWQFAQMGAYAFLIETHTQFQPSYDSAVSEAARVWPGLLRLLERPISISGRVTDGATGQPLAADVELVAIAFPNGETNRSGVSGGYHLFLPAGTYDLHFSAAGYIPATRRVSVTASSSAVLDVSLWRIGTPATPTGLRFVLP
jgi:hypothetical protein